MTNRPRILACDFDLTLCTDTRFGPPADDAQQILRQLRTRGWLTIIHTCKANSPAGESAVRDWLRVHDIPYDKVAGKPEADIYLDDHAHKYTSWADVWEMLRR